MRPFFLLLTFLFIPSLTFAALPAGVIQTAQVVGTAVATGGVSCIIPASATAGVPAVGTASAAAASVSTPVIVPLTVGGVALAGGYAIGSSLVTDLNDLYNAVKDKADKYPSLNNALASTPYSPTTSDNLPQSGSVIGIDGNNYTLSGSWTNAYPGVLQDNANKNKFSYSSNNVYFSMYVRESSNPSLYYVGDVYRILASPATTTPTWSAPTGMPSPAQVVPAITNPDGTLNPDVNDEVNQAIANGDVTPSIGVTPSQVQHAADAVAAQNATDLAQRTVEDLETRLATDPSNVQLQQELSTARDRLAESQREQARYENEVNLPVPELSPENAYDSTLTPPERKSLTSLLTNFFSNSPLLNMVRTFQISTSGSESRLVAGTFWGREIAFDFSRWAPILSGCGSVLLALSHGLALFWVIRG